MCEVIFRIEIKSSYNKCSLNLHCFNMIVSNINISIHDIFHSFTENIFFIGYILIIVSPPTHIPRFSYSPLPSKRMDLHGRWEIGRSRRTGGGALIRAVWCIAFTDGYMCSMCNHSWIFGKIVMLFYFILESVYCKKFTNKSIKGLQWNSDSK